MEIETTINIFSILVLLGGIQGLLFAVLLLVRKQNYQANRFLTVFLATIGLTLIHQFLIDSGYISHSQFLIGSTLPLEFIFPPTLYLYIRSITQMTSSKAKTWLHFIPDLFSAAAITYIGVMGLLQHEIYEQKHKV